MAKKLALQKNLKMKYDKGDDYSSSSSTRMMDFDDDLNESIDDLSTDLLDSNDLSGTTTISSTALDVRHSENKQDDRHRIDHDVHSFARDQINKDNEIIRSTSKSKYGSKSESIDNKASVITNSRSSPASKTLDALSGLDAVGGGNLLLSSPPSLCGNKKNKNMTIQSNRSTAHQTNQVTPTDKIIRNKKVMQDETQTHDKITSSLTHGSKRVNECEIENSNCSPISVNSSEHYSMHIIPFTSPAPLGIHIVQTSTQTCVVGQVYENSQSQHLGIQKGDIICDVKNGAKEAAYEDVIAWSSKHRSPQNPFLLMIKRPVVKMNQAVKKGSKRKGRNNLMSTANNDFTSDTMEQKNENNILFMGLSISCQRCKTKDESKLHHCFCPEVTKGDPLPYEIIKVGLRNKCKRCQQILRVGHRRQKGRTHRHFDHCPNSREYIFKQNRINKITNKKNISFPVKCMHCISVKRKEDRAHTPLLHHMLCRLHPKFNKTLVDKVKVGINLNCIACKKIYEIGLEKKKLEHSSRCRKRNGFFMQEDIEEDIEEDSEEDSEEDNENKSDDIIESNKTQLTSAIVPNEVKVTIKTHSKEDLTTQQISKVDSALNLGSQAFKLSQSLDHVRTGIEKGCEVRIRELNSGISTSDRSKHSLNSPYHLMENEKMVLPDTIPCAKKKSHFDTPKPIRYNDEIITYQQDKKCSEDDLISVPIQVPANNISSSESNTKTPAEITIASKRGNSNSERMKISPTPLKQPRWESCPNPWGTSGYLDIDKILLAPDFPPPLTERFVVSPLSIPLYQQIYKHGQYKALRLTRDRLMLRPWGFEVKRCDKNGACIVSFVAPCSPAECAQDVGSEQNMNQSLSFSHGLCVRDLVLCFNGHMVGGMNHMEFISELDICGSELIMVVARSKEQQSEADWIDFDTEKLDSFSNENTKLSLHEQQSAVINSNDSVTRFHKNKDFDVSSKKMICSRISTEATNIIENMDTIEKQSSKDTNKKVKPNSFAFAKIEQTKNKGKNLNDATSLTYEQENNSRKDFITIVHTKDSNSSENKIQDGTSQSLNQLDLKEQNIRSQINKRARLDRVNTSLELKPNAQEENKSESMTESTFNDSLEKYHKQIQNNTMKSSDSETNAMYTVQNKTQGKICTSELESAAVESLLDFGMSMLTKGGDFQSKKRISTEKLGPNTNKSNIPYANFSFSKKKKTRKFNSNKSLSSHNTDKTMKDLSSTNGIMERSNKIKNKIDEHENDAKDSTTNSDDSSSYYSETNGCVCGIVHPRPIPVFWILCDECDEWYNVSNDCVGFGREEAQKMKTWKCWNCAGTKNHKRKSIVKNNLQTKVQEKIEMNDSSSDESDINPKDRFSPPTETLRVGTVVNVIKRTWPGVNKLGGVGKILNVYGSIENNNLKYTIAYVLGGREKNVDAKYVSEVSDMNEGIRSPSLSTRSVRGRLSLP